MFKALMEELRREGYVNIRVLDLASWFMNDHGIYHHVIQYEDLGGTIYQYDPKNATRRHRGTGAGTFWTEWYEWD